jgi:hypothetical protein
MLAPWLDTKNTIRGKVMVSPKSRLWWILWLRVYHGGFVHQKCFNCALTNLLFGLCRSVWIIFLLINLPSLNYEASTCPSTPKCCDPKSMSNSFSFCCFHLWTRNWVHQRAWGRVIHSRHQRLNLKSMAISSTKQKSSFASTFNYYIPNTHQCQYENVKCHLTFQI